MKKTITLSLLLALGMSSALAQSPYGNITDKDNAYVKARQERVIKKDVRFAEPVSVTGARRVAAAPTELDPSLFVQPEGELMLMRRSGVDYLPVWGSPAPAEYTEKGTYVVKGTDGNYYFKNFVTNMCNGGTWIKGDVEGNVISVKTGQICAQLYYGTNNDLFTYYLFGLRGEEQTGVDYSGNEYTYTVYVPDEEVTEILFTIEDDGTITSQDSELLYGGVEEVDGAYNWPGQGDMGCTFYPFDEEPQVAPEGVELSDYVHSYNAYLSDLTFRMVPAGVADGSLYVKLADIVPDGVVKATIDGDKATFANNQFLGLDKTYSTLAYLKTCLFYKETDEWGWSTVYSDELDEVVLDYDATANRFSTMEDVGFVVNAGKAAISAHENYPVSSFYQFSDNAATPASPVWVQYMPYTETEYYAWGYAGFDIYTTDVDGNYILPDKLYYTCYLDDAPLVFSTETYPDLTEDMVEVPYGYSNNDIVGGGYRTHYIYFHTGDFDRFGVQTIYKGGNDERRSPIVYYGEQVGISTPTASATVVETTYYDLSGRKHNGLVNGVNVVVVKYSDGTVKSGKVMVK